MDAAIKGLRLNDFDEEYYADRYALQKYLEAGGDPEVVRQYINQRALEGFFSQSQEYWIAPKLAQHFFNDGTDMNFEQAFKTNIELRLRVANALDGNGQLINKTSAEIHKAIDMKMSNNTLDINDHDIFVAIEDLDEITEDPNSNYTTRKEAVFSALDNIAKNPNVDPNTVKLANQVLDGGRTYIPKLMPEHLRQTPNHKITLIGEFEEKASKATGIAGVAVDVANGNFVSAGIGAAMEAADSEIAAKALEKTGGSLLEKAGGLFKLVGKRIPVVGAVVTAGFVAWETGKYAVDGEWNKASAALATGSAETVGNIIGFGVGDAARETVRAGIVEVAGEEYAEIEKSGIRELGESAYELASDFLSDEPDIDIVADGALTPKALHGKTLEQEFSAKVAAAEPTKLKETPAPKHGFDDYSA